MRVGKSYRHVAASSFLVLVTGLHPRVGGRRLLMARHALVSPLVRQSSPGQSAVLGPDFSHWCHERPSLFGVRASLREPTLADAPALVTHLASLEVQRFIAPPPPTVEAFENFIMWAQCERARGRYVCYAVVPHGMN